MRTANAAICVRTSTWLPTARTLSHFKDPCCPFFPYAPPVPTGPLMQSMMLMPLPWRAGASFITFSSRRRTSLMALCAAFCFSEAVVTGKACLTLAASFPNNKPLNAGAESFLASLSARCICGDIKSQVALTPP